MRVLLSLLAAAGLMVCGCAHPKPSAALPPGASVVKSGGQELIVTPDTTPAGKVVKVNLEEGFVVLNYPVGHLPTLEMRLALYRRGLKVGEVKVVGPQFDDNIVADVVAGEAAPGDEAINR
jgi:hypothetical protein